MIRIFLPGEGKHPKKTLGLGKEEYPRENLREPVGQKRAFEDIAR